jgi:hypothetical protein
MDAEGLGSDDAAREQALQQKAGMTLGNTESIAEPPAQDQQPSNMNRLDRAPGNTSALSHTTIATTTPRPFLKKLGTKAWTLLIGLRWTPTSLAPYHLR